MSSLRSIKILKSKNKIQEKAEKPKVNLKDFFKLTYMPNVIFLIVSIYVSVAFIGFFISDSEADIDNKGGYQLGIIGVISDIKNSASLIHDISLKKKDPVFRNKLFLMMRKEINHRPYIGNGAAPVKSMYFKWDLMSHDGKSYAYMTIPPYMNDVKNSYESAINLLCDKETKKYTCLKNSSGVKDTTILIDLGEEL